MPLRDSFEYIHGNFSEKYQNLSVHHETHQNIQWTYEEILFLVIESIVSIFAVFGNALVIIVFCQERRLRRKTNYYIISLASADFCVGLLGIPFALFWVLKVNILFGTKSDYLHIDSIIYYLIYLYLFAIYEAISWFISTTQLCVSSAYFDRIDPL